jgi:hypothetical protein
MKLSLNEPKVLRPQSDDFRTLASPNKTENLTTAKGD